MYLCPLCNRELLEHNSTMWTGQRKQILRWVYICTQSDHKVEFMGSTEKQLQENISKYSGDNSG